MAAWMDFCCICLMYNCRHSSNQKKLVHHFDEVSCFWCIITPCQTKGLRNSTTQHLWGKTYTYVIRTDAHDIYTPCTWNEHDTWAAKSTLILVRWTCSYFNFGTIESPGASTLSWYNLTTWDQEIGLLNYAWVIRQLSIYKLVPHCVSIEDSIIIYTQHSYSPAYSLCLFAQQLRTVLRRWGGSDMKQIEQDSSV